MFKKYCHKIIIITFISISIIFCSRSVFAATINIVSSPRAGVYDVVLSLDKAESINAVEGSIIFNENSKVVPSIEMNESVIPLWIKNPSVSGNSISFSGIIPGGFSMLYDQFGGNPKAEGKLFSLSFPFAENTDSYTFTIDSAYLYANDGIGTAIMIPSKSITLPVSTDKNDFSSNINVKSVETSDTFGSPNKILFIVFLIICLIISYHFLKRTHHHIRRILKK